MIVIDPGHTYDLQHLKSEGTTRFRFYKDPEIHGSGHPGPSTQEVMRMVIERVQKLDAERPWEGNARIIQKAREIIAEFEFRAILRKIEKGELEIERLPVGADGHLIIKGAETTPADPRRCEARQFSDQMVCDRCSLTWDINDSSAPPCPKLNPRTE